MDNIKETLGSIDLDTIIEYVRKAIAFINDLIAKIVNLTNRSEEATEA